jgi:hypothetical protein
MLQEMTAVTSIFADNEISFTEGANCTQSDIFEISDRSGDEREHDLCVEKI